MTVLLVMEDMKWLRCVTCDSPVAAPVGDGGHAQGLCAGRASVVGW